MSPLVSIIIPVFNSEKYIHDTIESCLNQSYKNIEVIVVNDGSKDNSEEIIKRFNDTRVKYFLEANSGPCRARNKGIEVASGDLFQFLDADDILDSRKIEIQVDQYRKFGPDYVYTCEMGIIIKNQKRLEKNFDFYYKDLGVEEYFRKMFDHFGVYYTTGIWLISKELVRQTSGWNEKVKINNDGEYFSRIILLSKGLKFCPNSIFYYRRDVAMSVSKNLHSKEVYESWLYSYSCYVKHFKKTFSKDVANDIGRKALSVYYCNSYPKYPELLQECKNQIKSLGFNSPSPHGSKILKAVAAVTGVDFALKLRILKTLPFLNR